MGVGFANVLIVCFRKLTMFLPAPISNKNREYSNEYSLFLAGLDGVVTIGVGFANVLIVCSSKLTMFLPTPNPIKNREHSNEHSLFLAGLDGVEPSRRESKSRVLPLDYSPIFRSLAVFYLIFALLSREIQGNYKKKAFRFCGRLFNKCLKIMITDQRPRADPEPCRYAPRPHPNPHDRYDHKRPADDRWDGATAGCR